MVPSWSYADPFVRTFAKGLLLGTLFAAIAVNVAIALISPGDGGTYLALVGGGIFPLVLIGVGFFGVLVFPIAAILSWPWRRLTITRPKMSLILAGVCGLIIGSIAAIFGVQARPSESYGGALAGLVYGIVWHLVVKQSQRTSIA
jgi:hypothetical protein